MHPDTGATESDTPGSDRVATEIRLETAALRLLGEDGVLAGLNLRAVADAAGINRGLVYHYFGSRRNLLRSALRRNARRRIVQVDSSVALPLPRRYIRSLKMMLEDPDFLRILTLLVLDGDTEFVLLPLREMSIEHLVREQAAGHVGCDDVEVFHVAVMSLLMGYVLFRERYGAEFGIPLEELDARLIQALVRGDIVHDLALDAEEASPPDSPGRQQ